MAIRGDSGSDDVMAEINITPFTDVLLVLLIIFMVTATATVQTGFRVDVPQSASRAADRGERTVVTVTAEGQVYLGPRLVSPGDLRARLALVPAARRGKGLVIMADSKVRYAHLVRVMDCARQAGFSKLGLATRPGKGARS